MRILAFLVGVLALLVSAWLVFQRVEDPLGRSSLEVSVDPRRTSEGSASAHSWGQVARTDGASSPREDSPAPARPLEDQRPQGGTVVLDVRWKDGGEPVVDAPVEVLLGTSHTAVTHRRRDRTDTEGRAWFTSLPPGQAIFQCQLGGWLKVELEEGATEQRTLEIENGITLEGLVVDDRGLPVSGADLFLSSEGYEDIGSIVAQTLTDGSFRLRTASSTILVGAEAAGHVPSQRFLIERESPGVERLRLVLPRGGGHIEGLVTDDEGAPIPGARVLLANASRRISLQDDGTHAGPATRFRTNADEEGRFRYHGLEEKKCALWVFAPGYAPWLGEVTPSPSFEALTVTLVEGGRIEGRLLSSEGTPIRDVTITAVPETQRKTNVYELHRFWATTGPDGSYALADLPIEEIHLHARSSNDGTLEHSVQTIPGKVVRWDAAFEPAGEVSGVVLGSDGLPLAGWTVRCAAQQTHRDYWGSRDQTDHEGRFHLKGLRSLPHLLTVVGPEAPPAYPSAEIRDLLPNAQELLVRVAPPHMPTASFLGVLQDMHGQPLADARISVVREGQRGGQIVSSDTHGSFRMDALPGGRYGLRIEARDHAEHEVSAFELVANVVLDLGIVRLPAPGRLLVKLDREVEGETHCSIYRGDRWIDSANRSDGAFRSGPLEPGRYRVVVHGEGCADATAEVELAAGEQAELELVPPVGRSVSVDFFVPPDAETPESIHYELLGPSGRIVEKGALHPEPENVLRDPAREQKLGRRWVQDLRFGLAFGSYQLVTTCGELRLTHPFSLRSDEAAPHIVVLLGGPP